MSNCMGVVDNKLKNGPRCGGSIQNDWWRKKYGKNGELYRIPYDDGGVKASQARAAAAQLVSETKAVADVVDELLSSGRLHYQDEKRLNIFRRFRKSFMQVAEGKKEWFTDGVYAPDKADSFCRSKYYFRRNHFMAAQIVCSWRNAGSPKMTGANERVPLGSAAIDSAGKMVHGAQRGKDPFDLPDDGSLLAGTGVAVGAGVLGLLLLLKIARGGGS